MKLPRLVSLPMITALLIGGATSPALAQNTTPPSPAPTLEAPAPETGADLQPPPPPTQPGAADATSPQPGPAPAAAAAAFVNVGDRIADGARLSAGQALTSPRGRYRAQVQDDGNFVVYGPADTPLWATYMYGAGSYVTIQDRGDLAFHTPNAHRSTGTSGTGTGHYLTMQDDGNLVLYTRGNVAVWSSKFGRSGQSIDVAQAGMDLASGQTLYSPAGTYRFTVQADGNSVVYDGAGRALWASMTIYGTNTGKVALRGDGYLGFSAGPWMKDASQPGTGPGHHLTMQDDGNLVLYSLGGLPIWSSKFGPTGNTRSSVASGVSQLPGQAIVSPNGAYWAGFSGDGNYGVWGPGGVLAWTSMTPGGGARMSVQGDGNAGFFGAGKVVETFTPWTGNNNRMVMQDDGNLVLYTAWGQALWSSKFGVQKWSAGPSGPWPAGRPKSYSGTYSGANGNIPGEQCTIPFMLSHRINCRALNDLILLNNYYRSQWGTNLPIDSWKYSTYRSQTDQRVVLATINAPIVASVGTSPHGWGQAIDFAEGRQYGFGSPWHQWMLANAPAFGWELMPWHQWNGKYKEYWHWDYVR